MKNTILPITTLAAACFTMIPSSAEAATILQYDSLLATSNVDGVDGSATALTRVASDSTLVSSSSDYNGLGARAAMVGVHNSQSNVEGDLGDQNDLMFRFGNGATAGNGTLNGPLNAGHVGLGPYVSFTFTAAQDITLDNFSYHLFVNSNNAASTAARDSGLYVDVDGGGYAQFGALALTDGRGNLGTVSFTDTLAVSSGQVVTMRLGFTDRTRTNNDLQAATRIGDVIISATAIPEPSSTALLGLGGLALILRRRKA